MILKNMDGVWRSVEETLGLWAASLRGDQDVGIRPLFTQERVARNAGLFLEGLLGDEQRKTGWMRVEAAGRSLALAAAGDPLGRRTGTLDALRDIVRDYVNRAPGG